MRIVFSAVGLGLGAANGWLLAGQMASQVLDSAPLGSTALRLVFSSLLATAGVLVGLIMSRARKN